MSVTGTWSEYVRVIVTLPEAEDRSASARLSWSLFVMVTVGKVACSSIIAA